MEIDQLNVPTTHIGKRPKKKNMVVLEQSKCDGSLWRDLDGLSPELEFRVYAAVELEVV